MPGGFSTDSNGFGRGGFKADVYEDDSNTYIVAELPGIDRKDVRVDLENGLLTVNGERKFEDGEAEQSARFTRSITVGDNIDAGKVKAKLKDGELTITLPKSETRKPRRIAVK